MEILQLQVHRTSLFMSSHRLYIDGVDVEIGQIKALDVDLVGN